MSIVFKFFPYLFGFNERTFAMTGRIENIISGIWSARVGQGSVATMFPGVMVGRKSAVCGACDFFVGDC